MVVHIIFIWMEAVKEVNSKEKKKEDLLIHQDLMVWFLSYLLFTNDTALATEQADNL